MNRLITSILFSASLAIASPVAAQSAAEIAQDNTLDGALRIAALTELRRNDQEVYIDTLANFLKSDDSELSGYSAESLVSLAVMMGSHDLSSHMNTEDKPRHDMEYIQSVLEILNSNVTNPHPQVRAAIAPFLIGTGNEEALIAVSEAASAGLIDEAEAINYFFSAPSELGSPYLRRYAEGVDEDLAEKVISVLAADTGEQLYLRDEILTNVELPENRRAVALGGLAQYDSGFSNYVTQPEILDLALGLSRVPGTDFNGPNFVQNVVLREVRQTPELADFYSRRLSEIGPLFSSTRNAAAFENLTQAIEQEF